MHFPVEVLGHLDGVVFFFNIPLVWLLFALFLPFLKRVLDLQRNASPTPNVISRPSFCRIIFFSRLGRYLLFVFDLVADIFDALALSDPAALVVVELRSSFSVTSAR